MSHFFRRCPGLVMAIWFATWSGIVAGFQVPPKQTPATAEVGAGAEAGSPVAANSFRPAQFRRAAIIELRGPITGGTARYFLNRLEKAKSRGVDLVIADIDSPGGELEASYQIAGALRDINWAYTVAYTRNQAISGAALVSFGCHEIVMAPHARLGDIGVIYQDPQLFAFRLVPEKIQSDVVVFGRSVAEARGHNPLLVEAMIDKELGIYGIPQGRETQLRGHRWGTPEPPGEPWTLLEESGQERFLELTGNRGLQWGLTSELRADLMDLRNGWKLAPDQVVTYRYTFADGAATFFSHPFISILLVVAGVLALYLELSAPGVGIGAVVAALCATLFFGSRFMGGTAGLFEIILFLGGLAFLFMELFVIPGWGISGILGILLMVASAVLASQNFVIPESPQQVREFLSTLLVILCSACLVLVGAAVITRKIGKIPVFNQMVLKPPAGAVQQSVDKATGAPKPVPQAHPLVSVGDWGVADSVLRPAGRARFNHRGIDVVSDGEFIEAGRPIRVVKIQGNNVIVRAVSNSAANAPQQPEANNDASVT